MNDVDEEREKRKDEEASDRAASSLSNFSEEQRALLASIVDHSEYAVITIDMNCVITSWNHGAARIYSYTEAEAVGNPLSMLLPHDAVDTLPGIMERLVRGERTDHYESYHRSKDGNTIQVSVNISPMKDRNDRAIGASLIARDITVEAAARRRTEEAVITERKRFVDVLDMIPAYLVLLTPDHRVSFANRYFREHFGEDEGRRCFEYLFHLDRPCENCETFEAMRSGRPHQWEWAGPDGNIYDIFDFPFVETDGSKLVLEVGIAITQRKAAEEALKKAVAYNRSLIEASLDPLLTFGPDGKITDVNLATEKVTGCSRKELIGTDFSSFFTDPGAARAGYEKVFREGTVHDYALEIRRRDDHITPVLYNASVYRDDGGTVIGAFAAARDVTAQKKVEAELAVQRRRVLDRLSELEMFQRLTVGRELKMVELKKEIAELRSANAELRKKVE
ncbi:MAG: PAS domain S-box protein [Methanomassiliicoccus sp.]|nr:PAS domain S-box protein [Methanomassiliicoccus sp.]